MKAEKQKRGLSPLPAVLLRALREQPGRSAALAAVLLLSVGLSLLPPLVLERAVNGLTAGQGIAPGLAALYFALFALSCAADAGKEALLTVFGQGTTRRLRRRMGEKLTRLPAAYFTAHPAGETAARMLGDVDTVENLFAAGVVGMLADGCRVLGVWLVIFVKSPGLGLFLTVLLPLLLWFTRVVQRRMKAAEADHRGAVARMGEQVPETLRCLRTVRNLGREEYMAARYERCLDDSYRAREKANFCDAVYSPVILLVRAAVIALMMILAGAGGGFRRLFGLSVGTAVAVIAYVGRVFDPLESIGMEIQSLQSAAAGCARVEELLGEPAGGMPAGKAPGRPVRGVPCLRLSHVDFAYGDGRPVLRDFSLSVLPGEHVTLTGRTGAGKSTVFRLLLGLYEPGAGQVTVCGCPASEIPDGEKRRLFGCVEQQMRRVPGTVREQITLGDPAITQEDVRRAARLSGLDRQISALPEGYDTVCTEGLFSQGQWQLLSVARAVAADPPILLLDEITANLDAATETAVLAALRAAGESRTVLSISHRLYRETGGRQVELPGGRD